jgi:transcriptional regulator with XRE-family HTH domain
MLSLKALGERIASARRALKLTQTTVAESAGVSRPTLASLENGRAGELGFSKIARILSVLGLELRLSTANLQRPTLDELLADNSDEDVAGE